MRVRVRWGGVGVGCEFGVIYGKLKRANCQ